MINTFIPNIYLYRHCQLWLYFYSLKYHKRKQGEGEYGKRQLLDGSPTNLSKKFVYNVSGIKGELNGATVCDGDDIFYEIYKLCLLLLKERLETLVIKVLRILICMHYQMCVDNGKSYKNIRLDSHVNWE